MSVYRNRKLTHSIIMKAARAKWPQCELRSNRQAMTPEQRKKASDESAMRAKEDKELRAEALAMKPREVQRKLVLAAQFACDVNGDAPSIDHLRDAVAAANRLAAIDDRLAEIKAERDAAAISRSSQRYEIFRPYRIPGMGTGAMHCIGADTLEELYAKLIQ